MPDERYVIDVLVKLNFLKPTSFSFGYDYYASASMVASQFHVNCQIIQLLKCPVTYYWSFPLMHDCECIRAGYNINAM